MSTKWDGKTLLCVVTINAIQLTENIQVDCSNFITSTVCDITIVLSRVCQPHWPVPCQCIAAH